MSGKNSILGLSKPKKAEFLDILILMSISNFIELIQILNWVEYEKIFITLGRDEYLRYFLYRSMKLYIVTSH